MPVDSPSYKAKALGPESNSPDIGVSSFYYLLQSSLFQQKRKAGRPPKPRSGAIGRPRVVSIPTFGSRQAVIDEAYGLGVPEDLVREAEGRLEDEEEYADLVREAEDGLADEEEDVDLLVDLPPAEAPSQSEGFDTATRVGSDSDGNTVNEKKPRI